MQEWQCDAKYSVKCPCSYHDTTALIKQISLFETNTIKEYLTPRRLGLTWLVEDFLELGSFMIEFFRLPVESRLVELFLKFKYYELIC